MEIRKVNNISELLSLKDEIDYKQCSLKYGVICKPKFHFTKMKDIETIDRNKIDLKFLENTGIPVPFSDRCRDILIDRTLKQIQKCRIGVRTTVAIRNGCCNLKDCPKKLYHQAIFDVVSDDI
jgi:hypothetical protein